MPALVVPHGAASSTASTSRRAASSRSRSTPAWIPREISFAGPGKSEAELAQARRRRASSSTSSRRARSSCSRDLSRKARPAGARRGPRQSRFRAQVLGHEDGRRARSSSASTPKRCPRCSPRSAARDWRSRAFTSSAARRTLRPEAICEAQQKDARARASPRRHRRPRRCGSLNIGGGFGIPYFPGEQPLDLAPIGANLRELVDARAKRAAGGATWSSSSGATWSARPGIYVCRVIDRKISRGQVFLVTDGGLHHHLAASGNFGQVIRKNYPVAIGNKVHGRRARSPRSSGRCARRSICSPTAWTLPRRSQATWSSCSSPAPMARPPARRRFLSHPAVPEVLV